MWIQMGPKYDADKYIFTTHSIVDFEPNDKAERERDVVKKESVEAAIAVRNARAKNDAMWAGAGRLLGSCDS